MDTHPNTAYKLLKPNIVSNIVLYISRAPNESSAKLDQCLAHVLLGESTKPKSMARARCSLRTA